MLSTLVVYVSAKQASVGLWRCKRLASCTVFGNDHAGHHAFRAFLRQHADIPLRLIVDSVEEDYRLETLPHTSRRARREMVERKLNQLYRNNGYRTAVWVGREPDKRRDDRMLLMALSNGASLSPWIAAIDKLHAPLAGIYLLPVVSRLVVSMLKLEAPDFLLMTRQGSGLRQTYFCGGQLRVSRLTPLAGLDQREMQQLYAAETEKIRLYLISLRLLARDAPLHLVFPTTMPDKQLHAWLKNSQGVSCAVITAAQLARQCGLDAQLLQQHPELLHMQALASRSPAGNLASARQIQHYQWHQLRFAVYAAAALCLLLASAIAASNLLTATDLKRQLTAATAETRHQQQLYAEVTNNLPNSPLPGSDLKTAVVMAEQLRELKRSPQRLMQVVSAALEAQPAIMLNRMHWKLGDPTAQDAEDAASADHNPPPAVQSGFYEIAFIDGEISNVDGDYRHALDSVQRMVASLKRSPAVAQVAILQQPVNASSLLDLQGSTVDEQAHQLPTAQFRIKLTLKPEAAK